jgi:hypothetical protein
MALTFLDASMPKKPGFLPGFKAMMQYLSKKTRFLPQLFQYIKVRAIALFILHDRPFFN